jgi:hypothetical protein
MSKPRKKYLWLLSKIDNDEFTIICLAHTFRTIYKMALFELQIAEASMHERQAREKYKKTKECWIYNKAQFESFEEARWSPVGRIARIEKVYIRLP